MFYYYHRQGFYDDWSELYDTVLMPLRQIAQNTLKKYQSSMLLIRTVLVRLMKFQAELFPCSHVMPGLFSSNFKIHKFALNLWARYISFVAVIPLIWSFLVYFSFKCILSILISSLVIQSLCRACVSLCPHSDQILPQNFLWNFPILMIFFHF